MARTGSALFVLASSARRQSVLRLGKDLGISRRTAQRWTRHGPSPSALPALAGLVYPHDPALAAEIAAAAGTTLEALGLAPPPPPSPSPPPLSLSPPPVPAGVVDAVVCAAAEALDMMPRDVRAGLLAAFTRADEVGLDVRRVAEVLRGQLAPRAAGDDAASAKGATAGRRREGKS